MDAKRVKSLINKELWNVTDINRIGRSDLESAQKVLEKLKTIEERANFKALCLDELPESKTSPAPVIPLFLLSLVGRHPIDDAYIFSVFENYYQAGLYDEAEYVAETILRFNESANILHALADIFDKRKETEKKVAVWNRIVKVNPAETDVYYNLVEYYRDKGDTESELNCLKRVTSRHITALDFNAVKSLWPKVLNLENNIDSLIRISSRVAKTFGNEKGVFLLDEVLEAKSDSLDINGRINILKRILDLSKNNKGATENLIALYRQKYADNPRLEFCLADSGLLNNYLDSNVAAEKFENEIKFVEGAFVYHHTWHLGRIKSIDKDEIQVQFLSKKDIHKMSFGIAFSSLRILPKQHILVLKAGAPAEKIREKMMGDIVWGLKMLFNSFPDGFTEKQIKAELSPSILKSDKKGDKKVDDWTSWWKSARKEIDNNPYFDTSDTNSDLYILRDSPASIEEKIYSEFTRKKGFLAKYQILKKFIERGSTDSEEFSGIISYFENELHSTSDAVTAKRVASYLILNYYKNTEGMDFIQLDTTFDEMYTAMSPSEVVNVYDLFQYNELRKPDDESKKQDKKSKEKDDELDKKDIEKLCEELRKLFVDSIMETESSARLSRTLSALFRSNPFVYIKDKLSKRSMDAIRRDAVDSYQTEIDLLLWLFKNSTDDDWKSIGMEREDLVILKLQALLYINNKVAHGVDSSKNSKRAKQITDALFSARELYDYLKTCSTDGARRVYSYTENIPELDEANKIGVKHFILSNRKDADQIVNVERIEIDENVRIIPKGFFCTSAMLEKKKQELDHIMNVEIPENSKAIGLARELGDLRENSEFKFAREKQATLNAEMIRLVDEIDSAKVVKPEDVDLNYVEFGTKPTFKDNINGGTVTYSIFGAWESKPEENILNFQTPLVKNIYNMKQGERKTFEINGTQFDYTVEKIELADFNF